MVAVRLQPTEPASLHYTYYHAHQRKHVKQRSAAPPQVSAAFQLDLTPERYRSALVTGVPLHQELALKPGKYLLRLGVGDMSSHDVGTLEMPVEIAGLPSDAR